MSYQAFTDAYQANNIRPDFTTKSALNAWDQNHETQKLYLKEIKIFISYFEKLKNAFKIFNNSNIIKYVAHLFAKWHN